MMTEYNKLVDHLVSTMPSNSPPMNNKQERKSFDELYEEYSAMSIPEQLNNLKQLGRELVTTIVYHISICFSHFLNRLDMVFNNIVEKV